MTLLNAQNIAVTLGGRSIVSSVSLSLVPGEVVALIGPNGSGKTTLLRTLLGHQPFTGAIQWDDRPLRAWPAKQLARRVAYMPQAPTFDPTDRVIDVLRLGRSAYWQLFGVESVADDRAVAEVAAELDLTDLLRRAVATLSGGQRQRVFVGRCLVARPAALLLDEPSTFLDLKHQVELNQLLHRLARTQGIAVLMASHDLNLAALFADRVILLNAGVVRATGTPNEVLTPELLEATYELPMQRVTLPDGTAVVIPKVR